MSELTHEDREVLGLVGGGEGGMVEPEIIFRLLMMGLVERHNDTWELTDKGAAALDDGLCNA